MVVNKGYLSVIIWLVTSFLFLGCPSNSSPSNKYAPQVSEDTLYDTASQSVPISTVDIDSLRSYSISNTRHNNSSGIDVSVNPYYDEGYEQGQEDGYNDGIENLRGDSYDDACRYKGKARSEYELGYEEGYDTGFDDGFSDSDYDSEEEE